MLFHSLSFLGSFVLFTLAYYAIPLRLRWGLLLAGGLAFYASFEPAHLLVLGGVSAIAYAGGLGIAAASGRSRRLLLAASVLPIAGTLFAFKYVAFFATTLRPLLGTLVQTGGWTSVPAIVGLSFYTFSAISYLADVYAGRTDAERHPGYFLLYVAFFPKLLAGPIERARPFLTAVRHGSPFDAALVTSGLQLMLWGLFKKVVIADRLAAIVAGAYGQPAFAPAADLWLATYFFAFQLYCDFSGYSDIAIGAARVLGIELSANFRRPYLAASVGEFWAHRWHLSLSAWFRDYVYIPLGGSRVSRLRQSLNVLAVFLLSGLWHGANWTFVVWGGLNGLYQVASIVTARTRPRGSLTNAPLVLAARRLATFHLILFTWVFFRAASIEEALLILSRMAAGATRPALLLARASSDQMLFAIGLIAVLLAVDWLDENRSIWVRLEQHRLPVRWAAYYALVFSLIVFGVWNLQRFVYMQF